MMRPSYGAGGRVTPRRPVGMRSPWYWPSSNRCLCGRRHEESVMDSLNALSWRGHVHGVVCGVADDMTNLERDAWKRSGGHTPMCKCNVERNDYSPVCRYTVALDR